MNLSILRGVALSVIFCFGAIAASAQSTPTPWTLSTGDYSLTSWSSLSTASTYPTSMVFHTFASPLEFGNADQAPAGDWTLAYNLTTGTRLQGLDASGFAFAQTSSPQAVNNVDQNMGAAVLALSTSGRSNVTVTWTGATVASGTRPYVVRLQARIGSTGPWQNCVRPDGSFVQHAASSGQTTYTYTLPAAADNKSVVQLRWFYLQDGDGSGTRPTLRVDDIAVTSTPFVSGPVVSGAYVTTTGSTLVGYAGRPLPTFTVRVFNSLNNLETGYNSNLTVTRVSGTSFPSGTTTVQAFGGVATFSNVVFASTGSYVIQVSGPGISTQTLMTVQIVALPSVTGNFVPQYVYGFSNSNSSFHTPAYAHVTMSGLTPNTRYRYVVGASNVVEAEPTSAGAGNNIHYDHTTATYTFSSTKNVAVAGGYSTFTTGASETSRSFFISLIPSNNSVFTSGRTIVWQVQLANAAGNVIRTQQLASRSTAMETGPASTNATLIGDRNSQLGARNYVMLFDNANGTGQPIGIAMVQPYNTTVSFTTNRYRDDVENKNGAWMTQTPNSPGAAPCVFTFNMTDSYGDGWNGAQMTITDLSTSTVITTIGSSFTNGASQSVQVPLVAGRTYSLTWTVGGSWAMEVGVGVLDNNGNTIYSMPANSQSLVGTTLTSFTANCPPPPRSAILRIEERTMAGAVVSTMTQPSGVWNGVSTDPLSYATVGGHTTPIYLNTPSVRVLAPAAGDTLCAGTVTKIRWRADGMANVRVEVSLNGGATFSTVADNVPAAPGELDWAIPSGGLIGNVRVRVTGIDRPETNTSGSFAIVEPLALITPLVSANLCLGGADTLVAAVSGTVESYQWYKDGVKIPMSNSPFLYLNNMQYSSSGVYWCVVDGYGTCGTVVTNEAHVRVARPTMIVNQTYAAPGVLGETLELGVEAEVPNDVLGYRWYRGSQPLDEGDKFSGVTSNILQIHNFESDDFANDYYCVVTGVCGTATSRMIRVFSAGVFVDFAKSEYSLCGNGTVTITGQAYSNPGGEELVLQWYRNGVAISNGTSSTGATYSGANTSSLTISNATSADAGAYTLTAALALDETIGAFATANVAVSTTPSINTQPAAAEVCAGAAATMTVGASAQGAVSYQWYQDGTAIPGATDASLQIAAATAARAGNYTVVVSTACGSVTSAAAALTVKAATEITTQPAATVSLKVSETLTLSVAATGAGTLQYQWAKDGTDLAGEVAATYSKMNVVADDAGSYTCTVTAECGAVTSTAAVVTVSPVVSVDEDVVAGGVVIDRVSPNPVAGEAVVNITLPRMMNVSMVLVDASGAVVATIAQGSMAQGTHVLTVNGASVASGVYGLQTIVDGARHLQTVVIVK